MNISLLDLHWLAGFLEGEGSFTRCRNKKDQGTIMVSVSQVQREPLERCQRMCGLGKISEWKNNKPNQNDFFRWQLYGLNAEELMKLVFGLMSPKRQGQINTCLTWYDSKEGVNFKKNGRKVCRRKLHPWIEENLKIDSKGRKFCHLCKMEQQRIKRASLVIQEAEQLVKSS